MKKLFVVSKTHLDLGFTDYAKNIKDKYLKKFIPSAISLAQSLNKDGKKNYIWTTGSWLIKEALESGDESLRAMTENALKNGDIAPHALAFTTHSELMDSDILEYNLSIVDKIDKISGRKTIAAKMTDVPGHTKAIVPALAKHGIKLLHIGINTAAPYPKVPECFVWKCEDSEVVVIYADGYGGEFKCPYIDEILYFDNAADNHGTESQKKILSKISKLQRKYPDYEITAGRLDDIAESLWNIRGKLPVIEEEIGDTWIHGVATDPFKVAAFRTLCNLKNKWLAEGKLSKESKEYEKFADNLLCVCEHTWGQNNNAHFCDTENYAKDKFQKARKKDIVRPKNIFGYFPFRLVVSFVNTFGDKHYSYSHIEKSWEEQRDYIYSAVNALNPTLQAEAKSELEKLRPLQIATISKESPYNFEEVAVGDFALTIGEMGGINLSYKGNLILNGLDKSILSYRSYGAKDFDYYSKHYLRHHLQWAIVDNLRPGLKGRDKYPQGLFLYSIKDSCITQDKDKVIIIANFNCDQSICDNAGAPRNLSAEYTLTKDGLSVKLIWTDKDAVRSTESTACHLYPTFDSVNFVKIDTKIDPNCVICDGDRKLSVIEKALFNQNNISFEISSVECPLVCTDGGNILKYDNKVADIANCGLGFILHDNVWGTNFPLWYEDNAMFNFNIKIADK